MALKPCRQPGCPNLVSKGAWCLVHGKSVDKSHKRAGDKLYDTKRWRIRSRYFLASHPECACGCGHLAQTVDHIEPYVSEAVRSFWDESNWQSLTLSCHSKKTRQDVSERLFQ